MRTTFLESITDEPEHEEEDRYTLKYSGGDVLGTVEIQVKQFDIDVTWNYRVRGDVVEIYHTQVHTTGINATLRDFNEFEPLAKQIFRDISRHFNNMKFKRSSDLSPRIKEVMSSAGIVLESITDEPEQEEEDNIKWKFKKQSVYQTWYDISFSDKEKFIVLEQTDTQYKSVYLSINWGGNDERYLSYDSMLDILASMTEHEINKLIKVFVEILKDYRKRNDVPGYIWYTSNAIRDLAVRMFFMKANKMLPVNEMITPSVQLGGNMTPASPDSYVGKPVKTCPKCYGEGCKKCKGTGRLTEEFWNTFIVSRSMGRTEVPVFRNPTKSETETDFRQVSYDRGILDRKGVLYAWSGQLDALHEDMSHRMRIPLGAREGMSVDEMNLGLYMMPLEGLVEVSLYKTQIDKRDLAWAKKELATRVKSNKNVKKYMGSEFKVGFTFSHHKSRYGTGLGESKPFTNYLKEAIDDEPDQEELAPEEKGIRVGSRVKALVGVGNDLLQNQIGTVLWVGPKTGGVRQIGIEFDNDINGHDLIGALACPVIGKKHHCWFINEKSVKLIQGTGKKPRKLSLEEQIDYLEMFIIEWDKADAKGDKRYEKELIDQYELFTNMNGLPKISADELLEELKKRKK